jgi:hypothetical protein
LTDIRNKVKIYMIISPLTTEGLRMSQQNKVSLASRLLGEGFAAGAALASRDRPKRYREPRTFSPTGAIIGLTQRYYNAKAKLWIAVMGFK